MNLGDEIDDICPWKLHEDEGSSSYVTNTQPQIKS